MLRLTVVLMLPLLLAAPQALPVATGATAHVQLIEPIGPSLVVSKVSVTVAPVTADGPLLVTVIV